MTAITLRNADGWFYAGHGLDYTDEISRSMKFKSEADAVRVLVNLASRFGVDFEMVTIVAEPLGKHGITRWHVAACEQCEMFQATMEDPTFDVTRVLPGTRALRICEHCAGCNIESEMMRLGTVIQ